MDAPPQAQPRWFHLTLRRVVIALLAIEGLLWLSERFPWLRWTMQITVAAVGVAMLLTLVCLAVAEIRRFHPTPDRFVFLLLAVEVLLWLSERFYWVGWHKGYAVLTAVAAVTLGWQTSRGSVVSRRLCQSMGQGVRRQKSTVLVADN